MGCLKGLEHFQKQCELLKQEARDKLSLFALRGVCLGSESNIVKHQKKSVLHGQQRSCPLHYLWLVMEE